MTPVPASTKRRVAAASFASAAVRGTVDPATSGAAAGVA